MQEWFNRALKPEASVFMPLNYKMTPSTNFTHESTR